MSQIDSKSNVLVKEKRRIDRRGIEGEYDKILENFRKELRAELKNIFGHCVYGNWVKFE
jgi:hypothetical protein